MNILTRDQSRIHFAIARGPGAPSKDGWSNRKTLCGRTEPSTPVTPDRDSYDIPLCRRCVRLASFQASRSSTSPTVPSRVIDHEVEKLATVESINSRRTRARSRA